jgi:hypothetical protein
MHIMHRTLIRRRLALAVLAGVAAATTSTVAFAEEAAAEQTAEQMLAEAKALIAAAEAKQAAAKVEAAESRDAALARVLDDADRRSTPTGLASPAFLQEEIDDPDPFTAGHNGKFLLQSADGSFSMQPNAQLQIRYVANFNSVDALDDGIPVGDTGVGESFQNGLELRRVKLGIKGVAFSDDLSYDIKFAFNRDAASDDDDLVLENGYIDYTPETGLFGSDGLGFRIGQFKDPTFFEESTSSSRQLAADRSMLNEVLAGGQTDFIQAAGLLYKGDKVKALFTINDGLNSDNTNFTDEFDDIDLGIAGRVDLVVLGDSDKPFRDFTALGNQADAARVGAGFFVDINDGETDSQNSVLATVDASYETATGLGFFVAGVMAYNDDEQTRANDAGEFITTASDGVDFGGLVKVSQVLDDEQGWEIFGAYDFIIFDEVDSSGEDFYHEVVVGVNKYWQGHKVKMTIDAACALNGTPDALGSGSGIGYQRDGSSDDPQIAIRGQFQLLL